MTRITVTPNSKLSLMSLYYNCLYVVKVDSHTFSEPDILFGLFYEKIAHFKMIAAKK